MYIHIPFCSQKCDYCSFYSFAPTEKQMDEYLEAVLSCIEKWSRKELSFDTIYFGGGTPSYFGGKRIATIIRKIYQCFKISEDVEITVECNPSSVDEKLVSELSKAGVNRISMGVQSAVTKERQSLGRKSDTEQVQKAIRLFQNVGITNISLDLMLGIPEQTEDSLNKSLDFLVKSGAKHISAYMLKIEEGTPLFKKQSNLSIPDEDKTADLYMQAVEFLAKNGFEQYEVSNFAIKGFESRHNTKYWHDEEYLGIGPSAHSFLNGKRFFYKNDFNAFLNGDEPVDDGEGGSEEEYIMLNLRLSEGLSDSKFFERYGKYLPEEIFEKAKKFESYGLLSIEDNTIKLNPKGFLLSNSIIGELIL